MFERFTERARQVVVLAQDESRGLGHDYIGTEHILLGLLREEEGAAARALESLGVSLDEARAAVVETVGRGDAATSGQIPFTPRAKEVLELSLREALSLGHNHIGTEHILLGLVQQTGGVGAQILLGFGADGDKIRERTLAVLTRGRGGRPSSGGRGRWEYYVEDIPLAQDRSILAALLNELGADGWELAGVIRSGPGLLAFFKRRAVGL